MAIRKKKVAEAVTEVAEVVVPEPEVVAPVELIAKLDLSGNEDFNKLVAKVNELVDHANKDCC